MWMFITLFTLTVLLRIYGMPASENVAAHAAACRRRAVRQCLATRQHGSRHLTCVPRRRAPRHEAVRGIVCGAQAGGVCVGVGYGWVGGGVCVWVGGSDVAD